MPESNIGDFLVRPSHPTGALDFLKKLKSNDAHEQVEAKLKLRIVIVGAGLGGLAAAVGLARSGHSVTILEAAPALAEVGAGIQVSPNSSRHLMRWGVDKHVEGDAVEPTDIIIHRWQCGKPVARVRMVPNFRENYGAPYWQIHRADFHTGLKDKAIEYGAELRLNCKVADYDFEKPSLTLEGGEVVEADLIIAADGVKSVARSQFTDGKDTQSLVSGFAAYRGTIEADKVREYPDLKWFVENPTQDLWVGGGKHIVTYTLKSGTLFNFVLVHPEPRDASEWPKDEDFKSEMMEHFGDWDPQLVKILSLIDDTTKWPISIVDPLEQWAHPAGKFLIIGDAAHAMVPWMAQGAAMAVEDAAALEEMLKLIESKDDLPRMLRTYENFRIPRTRAMQQASLLNGFLYHLPDGPEQQARDEASLPQCEGKQVETSSLQWSDPSTQRWAYGYDACEEARAAWYKEIGYSDGQLAAMV